MSMGNKYHEIEFFGGPFDGHVQEMSGSPKSFICMRPAGWDSSWLKRWMCWLRRRHVPEKRVAIYELDVDLNGFRYHYIGSRTAGQIQELRFPS
jgi:hypothetical protein